MLVLKEYIFEIQLLLNIFMVSAIIILAFLYLKLAAKRKSNPLVEKIEYLCRNLKVLLEESEHSSDAIQSKIEEFKGFYNKNSAEIERRTSDLNEIISKLELKDSIKEKLHEKDNYAKIKKLLDDGHSVESISKMLKLSRGEVELIYKLKG